MRRRTAQLLVIGASLALLTPTALAQRGRGHRGNRAHGHNRGAHRAPSRSHAPRGRAWNRTPARGHWRGTSPRAQRPHNRRPHYRPGYQRPHYRPGYRPRVRRPRPPRWRHVPAARYRYRRARWSVARYYPVAAPPVVQCTSAVDPSGYYVWQCGRYAWDPYAGWYWIPGQWIENRPGYVYQPGSWYLHGGYYRWRAGGWVIAN